MRKVTLSILSFGLGALSMSLVGNHTSIFAQGTDQFMRMVDNKAFIPTVPPPSEVISYGNVMEGMTYGVDGMRCNKCVFKGVTCRNRATKTRN